MNDQPVGPRARFFRDLAENPYDTQALAASFGGSWMRHVSRNRHLIDTPVEGFRHMLNLSDAQVGLMLRNWRNAP